MRRLHRGVGGEERAEHRAQQEQQHARARRRRRRPTARPGGGVAGAVDLARAQRLAGDRLGGDGEGVEGEGEEGPDRRGHLVGGERHVAEPGRHPGRHEQHRAQGQGAHEQRDAAAGRGEHPPRVRRAAAPTCRAAYRTSTTTRAPAISGLGDDGAPGRAGDAPVQPVHEPDVEHDVQAEARRRRRGAGCGCPAGRAAPRWWRGRRAWRGCRGPRSAGRSPPAPRAAGRRRRRRASGPATTATSAVVTVPRAIASQVPSMPAAIAPAREPAPSWRATTAVVP